MTLKELVTRIHELSCGSISISEALDFIEKHRGSNTLYQVLQQLATLDEEVALRLALIAIRDNEPHYQRTKHASNNSKD